MKLKRKILLSCFFLGLGTAASLAQQDIVATGGDATGSGGKVSYSIGQMNYLSAGTGDYIIQGLQQPFEISEISGIDEKGIKLVSSVYPNPSSGMLTLSIENDNYSNINYIFYDELGKLLMYKRVNGPETTINLSEYKNAVYFLKIVNNDKELKTYKIVKQN